MTWRTKNGSAARIIRAYKTQFSSSSPSAFSIIAIGLIKAIPRTASSMPVANAVYTNSEKYLFALSLFPSP